jgi:hypothetical protein
MTPFEAPRLKLRRARRHLAELAADVDAFMAREPFRLVVEEWELNAKVGHTSHAWVVRIKEPIPSEFSAVLGDVLHNLRAALDLLACDLVRAKGGDVKHVYFPFCADPADLNAMIKRRGLYIAGPEAVEAIESLKPYKGGNTALRAIHDLDILDKHQALVPVISGGTSPAAMISFFGNSPTPVLEIASKIDRDGQALMVMPPVLNIPLGTELPAKWHIMFGSEADPYGGCEIVPTLSHFADLVEQVVEYFAKHFGPDPARG